MRNLDIIKKSQTLLSGHWMIAIIICFILGVIGNFSQKVGGNEFNIIYLFFGGVFSLGQSIYFLNIVRGKEARFENLFDGFKKYVPATVAFVVGAIVIVLGFIAFIIPGIMLIVGLSQAFFILADENENMSGIDALKKSWEMMDGFKMKYFLLSWIHFGMVILGLLALVIGVFFVFPIIYNSIALFYDMLKKGELQSS